MAARMWASPSAPPVARLARKVLSLELEEPRNLTSCTGQMLALALRFPVPPPLSLQACWGPSPPGRPSPGPVTAGAGGLRFPRLQVGSSSFAVPGDRRNLLNSIQCLPPSPLQPEPVHSPHHTKSNPTPLSITGDISCSPFQSVTDAHHDRCGPSSLESGATATAAYGTMGA